MKKLIFGLAALLLVFGISGCATNKAESVVDDTASSRFVELESSGIWSVVYDKDTKVMYTVSTGYHSSGIFTMLVNADGTPLLYGE